MVKHLIKIFMTRLIQAKRSLGKEADAKRLEDSVIYQYATGNYTSSDTRGITSCFEPLITFVRLHKNITTALSLIAFLVLTDVISSAAYGPGSSEIIAFPIFTVVVGLIGLIKLFRSTRIPKAIKVVAFGFYVLLVIGIMSQTMDPEYRAKTIAETKHKLAESNFEASNQAIRNCWPK